MEGFGTVEGVVTNASYGDAPLPDARVEIPDARLRLDHGGRRFLRRHGRPRAPTRRLCSLTGFETQEVTLEVIEDGMIVQDFALTDIAGPEITDVNGPVATQRYRGSLHDHRPGHRPQHGERDVTLYWRVGMPVTGSRSP